MPYYVYYTCKYMVGAWMTWGCNWRTLPNSAFLASAKDTKSYRNKPPAPTEAARPIADEEMFEKLGEVVSLRPSFGGFGVCSVAPVRHFVLRRMCLQKSFDVGRSQTVMMLQDIKIWAIPIASQILVHGQLLLSTRDGVCVEMCSRILLHCDTMWYPRLVPMQPGNSSAWACV